MGDGLVGWLLRFSVGVEWYYAQGPIEQLEPRIFPPGTWNIFHTVMYGFIFCSATLDVGTGLFLSGTPTIDLEGSMMQLAHQGRDKQNPGNQRNFAEIT